MSEKTELKITLNPSKEPDEIHKASSGESSTATPKEKAVLTPVKPIPENDLRVVMGRQRADFWTNPEWPAWENMTKPINYVVRGDGIWEIRQNEVGVFCIQHAKGQFPGFPKENNGPWFGLRHGLIPYPLLEEIKYFFKDICDDSKDEVYVQIFWDEEKEEYFNYCPKQKVSTGSVEYERDTELEARATLVLEIHSHNTMGAYFSSIDNDDEKGDRLFGVIGHLNKLEPEMKFSYVCGGKRQECDVSLIFEEAPEGKELYPREWRDRVTKASAMAWTGTKYERKTEGQARSEGVYRHQSANGGTGSYKTKAYETGTSLASSRSGQTKEQIEQEVEKATRQAQVEIDAELPASDFLKNSDSESGVSEEKGFFRRANQEGTEGSLEDDADYDEKIKSLIGMIEESYLQQYAVEGNMNAEEKTELFSSLVDVIASEDLRLLADVMVSRDYTTTMVESIVENDQADLLYTVAGEYYEDDDEESSPDDSTNVPG